MADQQQLTGLFIQQTPIFDAQQWRSVKPTDDQFSDLMVLMHQQLNQMALILNLKTTGYHLLESFNNSNQWFNPATTDPLQLRSGFTKVVHFTALNAGINTLPHGLNTPPGTTLKTTYIGGSATNSVTPDFWPIPNIAAAGAYISVVLNGTNVIIDNQSGIVFTSAEIVIEYLEF